MTATAQERLVDVEVRAAIEDRVPVGAEKTFRSYDPDQVLLMAPVLRDWVPDGDLAHFVADLVDSGALDLSAIYAAYEEERGFPPYDPRLMVKLLVYGYANGVTSSRKLERASYRDVAVRMLCADQAEDEEFGADRRGDELPDELQRRESRLARIREAKQALEAEARAAEAVRRAELEEQGKTPRNPPGGRDSFKPKPKAQRNFTDPDSRIMKASDGAFHQCYNGQAIVDSVAQVIVVCELSDQAPDARLLEPALDQLDENLQAIDARLPDDAALLGDAGYFSEHNIAITAEHGLDPHIATGRFKHSEPPAPAPRGPIPKNATSKQLMARKLKKKAGAAAYARRKTIVEPVFGQMTTVQDARQLRLRGKPAARAQWRFQCAIHNLLKLHRNGGLALIPTG